MRWLYHVESILYQYCINCIQYSAKQHISHGPDLLFCPRTISLNQSQLTSDLLPKKQGVSQGSAPGMRWRRTLAMGYTALPWLLSWRRAARGFGEKKNSAMVPLIPDSNMFPIMIFMEIWGMPNFGTNSIVCILGRLQDLVLCTPSRDRWFEVLFSQRKGVMMPLQGHPGNQQWNREMYCLVNRCK